MNGDVFVIEYLINFLNCIFQGIEIKSKEQQTTNNNESGKSDNQSTFQQPSEASIRKAYFKLAQKYHPDKNPDGREMFVKVNKAYEFLCLASRIKQGPNDFNLYLLLKTQTILYRRYKQILSEYKYAGYPMLIRILDQEWKNDQLFSLENTSQTALLPISIELLYYTLDCSELNCEELRRENGLEILTQVFQRCAGVLTKASKSDDFIVKISNYSALCYGVCGHFEKCRDLFVNTDLQCILKEICHCFNYTHLKQLCTSLCKASRSLCIQDQRLRDMFYKHGLLVYLCLGLFNYDYTLEESGIEMDIEKGDNRQYIDNQLSFDYMATLITLLHDNKDSFCLNTSCTFLTSYIVKQMLKIQPDESQLDNKDKYRPLLKLLNSNTETPYMIWDNSCRQELVEYLEQTRQILMKNEYKLNIDEFGRNFSYTAHKNELIIGDIFVRIYNLQPTTVLEEPKKFCTDLLDFLGTSSQYINTLISMKQQQQPQGDDSSKTVDVIQLEKQAHIEQALEALKNVIRNNIGIETLCLGHFKLLFSLLRMDNIHRTQILALELILHITGSNECVQDISQSNVIVYLLLALKSSPSKVQNDIQQLVLDILACLCSNTKIVKDLFTSGGLLYLLDIFANGQNSNIREKSAETMSKLMSDRLHGPRIRLILQKFLPSLFMDAMRDSCETSIQLFETQHENPELIWNDHIREMTCERISQLLTEFYSKQKLDPTEVKWSIDDNFLLLADDDEATRISQTELIIGGVYIRLLIQNPGWIVRRPKEFLTELLTRWSLNIKHPLEAHVNEFEMLTQCLMQLLNAQPTLCEHIPSIGFLPTIIQGLECKDNNSICASSIKILYQLSKNETCIQTMSTTCPQIISGFRIAMTIRHDHLGLIAECLHSLFKIPNNDEFIRDALKCQLIDYILTLLGQPLVDIEKPGSCKAHLVDTCKLMTQSLTYGEQILKILQQSTVWNDYKDQRHDLFIQTSTHMQAITGGSSGPAIAGYLTSTPSQIQQKIPPPIIDHGMD
ncbi:unnamed protein product [Didymodactylos carnosus]|uniref:J domain-containing protein n=1 Tax=Didymodactylos carnosus TaxID=1234261 RepID=A0A8S2NTK6_9BILA|nr:unnamed protein product [Didymodactylos carnosus]CAF4018913.1 unnamed protein product [Didymodactylos carnosus]